MSEIEVFNPGSKVFTANGSFGPISAYGADDLEMVIDASAHAGTTPTLYVTLYGIASDGSLYSLYATPGLTALQDWVVDLGPGTANQVIIPDSLAIYYGIAGSASPSVTAAIELRGKDTVPQP